MTVNSDTSSTGQPNQASAVILSLSVLFGDAFVTGAEPAFLESFFTRGPAWANALKAIWALSGGNLAGPAAPEGRQEATAAAAATGRPAPTSMQAVPPPRIESVTPAPAAPAVAAPEPQPNPGAAGSRVEIFDPSVQEDAPAPTRDRPWTYQELHDDLVALLQEATGYPSEVLDEDADLEADLAIDSVKQVEALGTLRERYALTLEDDFAIRDYRTIRKAASYLTDRLNRERPATAVS